MNRISHHGSVPRPVGTKIRNVVLGEVLFVIATFDGAGLVSPYEKNIPTSWLFMVEELRRIKDLIAKSKEEL